MAHHAHTSHLHTHAHGATRGLTFALALNAVFTAVEGAAGLALGSISLLADAGHNLTDVVALAVALAAARLAARPPTTRTTFGFKRAEILAAFVNAVTLVVIAIVIVVEAVRRLGDAPDVPGGWMIAVAAVGIAVNAAGAAAVARGAAENLNLRAAFVHLLGDAASSAVVIVAGAVVLATGFAAADPIAGLALAALILWSALGVLRESTAVLMEQVPGSIDLDDVAAGILAVPGVVSVHDLHIWTIGTGFDALSAHVLVAGSEDCHARRQDVERVLRDRFGVEHTTLQVDHAHDTLIQIAPR